MKSFHVIHISIKVNNELRLFPLRQHADICHSSVIQVVSFSVALHAGRWLVLRTEQCAEVLPKGVGEGGVEDGVGAAPRVRQQYHELKGPGKILDQDLLTQGPEVEGVERQPANAKHQHHRHHHPGDLSLHTVVPVCRQSLGSLPSQGEKQRRVGDGHHGKRQRKAHNKGVGEDAEPPGVGDYVWYAQALIRWEVERHGKNGEEWKQPQERWDQLGTTRCSPPRKPERVGQRHVSVDAHHRQAEDAGELVDAVQHHDHLAGRVAKHPPVLKVLAGDEGKSDHEESVGQSQIENVHRCGRWHFVDF